VLAGSERRTADLELRGSRNGERDGVDARVLYEAPPVRPGCRHPELFGGGARARLVPPPAGDDLAARVPSESRPRERPEAEPDDTDANHDGGGLYHQAGRVNEHTLATHAPTPTEVGSTDRRHSFMALRTVAARSASSAFFQRASPGCLRASCA